MGESAHAEELFRLPDGRNLSYVIYGDKDAVATVFFNHGLPGSHVEGLGYDKVGKRKGLRIIAIDRPGMAGSTFQPGRRLIDWPADVRALAEHLGVKRFAVFGASGGGPYALACLHLLTRSQCVGACLVASIYPVSLGIDGMMIQNRLLFNIAPWSSWLVEKAFDLALGGPARDTEHPEKLENMFDENIRGRQGPDAEVWSSDKELQGILVEDVRQALRNGSKGAALDTSILTTAWGFGLEDIAVGPGELVMWHGAQDKNAPVAMVERARALMPNSEARISQDDAHISVQITQMEDVADTLSKMLSSPSA